MFDLYCKDWFSVVTIVFVLGVFVFIMLAVKNNRRITKWGWMIGLFLLIGTAVSALSAMRDGLATADAVFALNGVQAIVCTIAGGAILLTGVISIFLKKELYKKRGFYAISALFIIQVAVIEASRLLLPGGN